MEISGIDHHGGQLFSYFEAGEDIEDFMSARQIEFAVENKPDLILICDIYID